ncbi:MAG: serine protease [Planctomycetes bacterium]|nr:serine protease [Planctomycetota bacterium]
MLQSIFIRTVGALILASSQAIAQSPREVAEKVMPSVVLLVMQDQHGQPIAMASGFVVRDGIVATNFHAIEGAGSADANLVRENPKGDEQAGLPDWVKESMPVRENPKGDEQAGPKDDWRRDIRLFPVKGVVASDPEHDLVLLSVDGLKAAPLTVADSEQVAIGDQVYVVGNPQGLEGTFSAGIVSGIRKVGEDSLLQITAPISPGSSGGPVLNAQGEVIGVAVATFKGGQNLNFAIPSKYLSALMAQQGPPNPLSETAKVARNAPSIVERMGDRLTEGVTGGDFIWGERLGVGHFLGREAAYSLTLRNNLRHDVQNVRYLIVFYNRSGEIIEAREHEYIGPHLKRGIRAGLAGRVEGYVHRSVQELTTPMGSKTPDAKVEIRILDFEIVAPQTIGDEQ